MLFPQLLYHVTPDPDRAQLALRAGPEHGAIWQLAAHAAGARVFWLCHVFGEPGVEQVDFTGARAAMDMMLGRLGPHLGGGDHAKASASRGGNQVEGHGSSLGWTGPPAALAAEVQAQVDSQTGTLRVWLFQEVGNDPKEKVVDSVVAGFEKARLHGGLEERPRVHAVRDGH